MGYEKREAGDSRRVLSAAKVSSLERARLTTSPPSWTSMNESIHAGQKKQVMDFHIDGGVGGGGTEVSGGLAGLKWMEKGRQCLSALIAEG